MNSPLRWFTVAVCSSLLMAGCKKKETAEAEVAREAEKKLPADEQVAPAPAEGSPITASAAPTGAEQAAYEAWFKKHNLDLNDPKMLDADPDGDGFSNREEFLADTDPHDPNSRPGIHKSIRMKEYIEVRLPFVLESIEGDKARIKRTDQPDAKPLTVKEGDVIKGFRSRWCTWRKKKTSTRRGRRPISRRSPSRIRRPRKRSS